MAFAVTADDVRLQTQDESDNRESLSDFADQLLDLVDSVRRGGALPSATPPIYWGGGGRSPFYVLDEPEQHLHPLAQRHLAVWLRNLLRSNDAQAVAITHSVAFLDQADQLAYVLRSPPHDAIVHEVSRHELDALGQIAAELGLDRGELLTTKSVCLFVEGESDKYVLEGLFGERLRRSGIAIFVLHGATQAPQIADAQMLLSVMSARPALLVDNLMQPEIRRLMTDAEYRSSVSSRRTEATFVAKLLNELIQQERLPELFGIPAEDIFMMLDEQAIRHTFAERAKHDAGLRNREPYPDHATARRLFDKGYPRWTGNAWKAFLFERYGIPREDVTWYREVATSMKSAGVFPEPLIDIVNALEQVSLKGR